MTATPVPAGPAAVVLLSEIPAGIGTFMSSVMEGAELPGQLDTTPEMTVTMNGREVLMRAVGEPLRSPELDLALQQSPMARTLHPAVAGHRSHLVLEMTADDDPHGSQQVFTAVTARIADRPDAVAVFLPHHESLTTDVLYCGEAEQQPSLTWFRAHAMLLDPAAGTAHAFTRGLHVLGGQEVQLSGAVMQPDQAWTVLRTAVTGLLDEGRLPTAGASVQVDGTPYTFTPGTDLVTQQPVLDLVAGGTTGESADRPKKRRLFGFGRR